MPSKLILKVSGPRLWLSIILIVWGVIMAVMSKCKTGPELIVARFFLGVAEVCTVYFSYNVHIFSCKIDRKYYHFVIVLCVLGWLISGT